MNKFQYFLDLIQKAPEETLNLSLVDVHHKGIFSLVIKGTRFGELTRVFISDVQINPFEVQLHTHRYPLQITALVGEIIHHVAFKSEIEDLHTITIPCFNYHSPMNGEKKIEYVNDLHFIVKSYNMPIGSSVYMTEHDFHTMSCSKGSIWVVEEQGFRSDYSRFLGIPFETTNFYKKPTNYQLNSKRKQVTKLLQNIVNAFNNGTTNI